jgi:glycosyltransferase involved in cell wall biosynthesis
VSKISKHGKTTGGPVNMVYTGAIYHVNFDAFRVLIYAIDRLEELDITLQLYTAQPKEFIEAEGICGRNVELHQHFPPSEINIAQINADILFIPFSFKKEMKMIVKTSAPGKFADYLASGRPIFAVVPEESFVDRYLKKYQCGVSINSVNPERVADELKRLIEDISLRQNISENAVKRAHADFSPKKSQETFLKTLERSV